MFIQKQKEEHWLMSILRYTFLLFVAIVCLKVARIGYHNLWAETRDIYSKDASIFMAMGRGILNGYLPYHDLFESKPPGNFIVTAISFLLTNDMTFAHYFQAFTLAVVPFACMYGGYSQAECFSKRRKIIFALVGFLFGAALMFYSSFRSGSFQTESFGSAFAILYLITVINHSHGISALRTVVAAACIFCSIGFKEPFLLPLVACGLFSAGSFKGFVKIFVIPFTVAVLAGLLVLSFTGYLGPYLDVYLFGEMITKFIFGVGRRVPQTPFYLRAFNPAIITSDLNAFIDKFSFIIGFFAFGYVFIHGKYSTKSRFSVISSICTVAFAIYLGSMAVGLNGAYWTQHFVFIVPIYAALCLVFLKACNIHWRYKSVQAIFVFTVTLLSVAVFTAPQFNHNFVASVARKERQANNTRMIAKNIDQILYNCNLDRYLFLGPEGRFVYGFTEHSPYGPTFFQNHYWVDENRPFFRQEFKNNLKKADFIVFRQMKVADMHHDVTEYIRNNFTTDPWDCAGPQIDQQYYAFLYRKQPHNSYIKNYPKRDTKNVNIFDNFPE